MRERLTILVIVGRQVGMGSESDCLFGQLDKVLWTSDSEAGVKLRSQGEWQEERVSAEMM